MILILFIANNLEYFDRFFFNRRVGLCRRSIKEATLEGEWSHGMIHTGNVEDHMVIIDPKKCWEEKELRRLKA